MDWTNFRTFFWTISWTVFRTIFLDHFIGGKHTSVLREGWEAEGYYKQRGMGGGCNSKHCWLMELSLDRTNYFNRFFD